MKAIKRRTFLKHITAIAGALPSAGTTSLARPIQRRVGQSELATAIELHQLWLQRNGRGRRAAFANCDLSGLDFLSNQPGIVDLRGSDFTEANLSGITGNQVSFHLASLQYARLSQSHLKLPIFSGATLRGAQCNRALWGWPSSSSLAPPPEIEGWNPAAAFLNSDLSETDFEDARVLGYFSGTTFCGSSLINADLSHSTFAGVSIFCDNSFAGANLASTRFRHASISATNFRSARIDMTDFSFADIGAGCTWPVDYGALAKAAAAVG